jgi:ABC-2 type transport system permease protein
MMHKILVIAAREYRAAVRTKSFLITLVFMPILMVGSVGLQVLVEEAVPSAEKHFAVVDRTPGGQVYPALEAAARQRNTLADNAPQTRRVRKTVFTVERIEPSADTSEASGRQRYDLSERVRHGEFAGFLDIGPDVLNPGALPSADEDASPDAAFIDRVSVRYQSNSPLYDVFQRWAARVVNETVVRLRCAAAGLPPDQVREVSRPVPLRVKGLSRLESVTGEVEDTSDQSQAALLLVPAGLAGIMLLVVLVGTTPLMHSVVEEKMQRIAEVLLGSVSPFGLMMGKLLGMMGVSLTLAAFYLAGAYWVVHRVGLAEFLPPGLIAWFLVYLTLAVLMDGALFIAVGAASSDIKETQMLMLPVVLMICLPFFTLRSIIQEPHSAFATWVSLFPPGTPMLMIARQSIPPGVPWWQPVAGVLGVLATTVLFVYAAGRVFRVGILMQGKGARLSEIVRWVFRG